MRSWPPVKSPCPHHERDDHEPDARQIGDREQTEEANSDLAPVLAAHPESTESEEEHHREQRRGQRQHEPDPPVVGAHQAPAMPGADDGEDCVRSNREHNERRRLTPRVTLRPLEPILAHR